MLLVSVTAGVLWGRVDSPAPQPPTPNLENQWITLIMASTFQPFQLMGDPTLPLAKL